MQIPHLYVCLYSSLLYSIYTCPADITILIVSGCSGGWHPYAIPVAGFISRFSLRGLRALHQHHKRSRGNKAPQAISIFRCVIFSPLKKNGRVFVDFVTSKFLEFSRSLQRSLAPLPWHRLHFTNGLFCFIPITWRIDKKIHGLKWFQNIHGEKIMEQTSGLGWSKETFTVFMWGLLLSYQAVDDFVDPSIVWPGSWAVGSLRKRVAWLSDSSRAE